MNGVLKLLFSPLSDWNVTDDMYKAKVALYNAKDKVFYMGEVECDGEKLTVSYDEPTYYGLDVEFVTDYDGWYYMTIDDDADNETHDEPQKSINDVIHQEGGILDVMSAGPMLISNLISDGKQPKED